MLHFYEGQVRKFLTQFMRILGNFSIETGKAKDDTVNLRAVPVVYGDPTRQVANIIRNNSENAMNYTQGFAAHDFTNIKVCILYTSTRPRDLSTTRMPASA